MKLAKQADVLMLLGVEGCDHQRPKLALHLEDEQAEDGDEEGEEAHDILPNPPFAPHQGSSKAPTRDPPKQLWLHQTFLDRVNSNCTSTLTKITTENAPLPYIEGFILFTSNK